MDFYQVLEKRRTIRDFSDKKVTDEVLKDNRSLCLDRLIFLLFRQSFISIAGYCICSN